MLVNRHIIFGAIISIFLLFLFPPIGIFNASLIFLSSVLIDFDHYLYYIIKKHDFSLKKAYLWSLNGRKSWLKLDKEQKLKYELAVFAFHGLEFCLILLFLLLISNIFFWILLGVVIHLGLDFIDIFINNDVFYQKVSPLYTHIINKKQAKLRL
jgi:hypothetical protein